MESEEVDVEAILQREESAMALLERLRLKEPPSWKAEPNVGGGRRDFKRWPIPPGVSIELHDGQKWHLVECKDLAIGGARLVGLPTFAEGPTPARLIGSIPVPVLVLSDLMWIDREADMAGVHFEFLDNDERDLWAGSLIDALLARYAIP